GMNKFDNPYAVADDTDSSVTIPATASERLKEIFKQYDVNGDGCITPNEIQSVFKALGQEALGLDAERIFKVIDANHDGKIQFTEFVDWMFGFADICDDQDLKARAIIQGSMTEAVPEAAAAAVYKPSADSEERSTELLQLLQASAKEEKSADAEDLMQLLFDGEESDLIDCVAGLRIMNARQLRDVFQGSDVSKKGFLNLKDLRQLLYPKSIFATDSIQAVAKVFLQMDKNSDGKIHCGEFVSHILTAKNILSTVPTDADKRSIASAFSVGDADKSGSIGLEEFEKMLGPETDEDREMVKLVFASIDADASGAISVVEFAHIYGKELVKQTHGMEVKGSMHIADAEERAEESD
ncbi:unnamed protein product, partial [Polarella glacialis]